MYFSCFQLFDVIVEADDLSDEQKARICRKLGEADKVTLQGIAYSCFLGLFAFLSRVNC